MTASGERGSDTPGRDLSPVGLVGLYAALDDTATRHGFDAIAVAIDDPDLGRQVFASGTDAHVACAVLATDSTRDWWTSPTSDEPPDELTALRALGATALRLGVLAGDPDPTAVLEVAVRAMPGVARVGRRGALLEVTVHPGQHAEVLARVAATNPGTATLVVLDADRGSHPAGDEPPPVTKPRAELVTVHSRPETGELEVHLRRADRRTVGRGPLARAGTAAAAATLDALAALDPDSEPRGLRIGWVRTIDTTPDRQFLVAVSIGREQGTPLYGLATGTSPIEGAARAVLHACNRVSSLPAER